MPWLLRGGRHVSASHIPRERARIANIAYLDLMFCAWINVSWDDLSREQRNLMGELSRRIIDDDLPALAASVYGVPVAEGYEQGKRDERQRIEDAVLAVCDAMWGENWAPGARDKLLRAIHDA